MSDKIGNLEIVGIRDAGVAEKERLLLRATLLVDPAYYAVINVYQTALDKLTILNDKVYWFPSGYIVKQGEYIRLYTNRAGAYSKEEAKYGDIPAIFHNFYWGLAQPVLLGVRSNAFTIFKMEYWNTVRPS